MGVSSFLLKLAVYLLLIHYRLNRFLLKLTLFLLLIHYQNQIYLNGFEKSLKFTKVFILSKKSVNFVSQNCNIVKVTFIFECIYKCKLFL